MRALVVVTRVAQSRQGEPPSKEWVASREELLARIPAAALRQVEAPLTWIWRACPERREQVQEMAQRVYPEAIVLGSEKTCDAVAPDAFTFITARLDSDDAFLPAALDHLASLGLPPDTLVNWPCGWQLDWQGGRVGPRERKIQSQGPFLAITHERRERMLDVGGHHGRSRKGREVLSIHRRSWLQVIHGGNLKNAWQGQEPLGGEKALSVLGEFGVSQ